MVPNKAIEASQVYREKQELDTYIHLSVIQAYEKESVRASIHTVGKQGVLGDREVETSGQLVGRELTLRCAELGCTERAKLVLPGRS